MSTAQIFYEKYKVLPKRVREEFKALIFNEEEDYNALTLMEEIEIGLREVKAIQEGKISGITFEDLEKEIEIIFIK